MGNSASGSRLGGGGGGSRDGGRGGGGEILSLEVVITNRLGLPLSLVFEKFSDSGDAQSSHSLAEVPRTVVASGATIRVQGAPPTGCAVYACSRTFRRDGPKQVDLPGAQKKDLKLKSHGVDHRDGLAEQYLAIVAAADRSSSLGGGLFGSRSGLSVNFGAAYGAFDYPEDALAQAEAVAAADVCVNGVCAWRLQVDNVDDGVELVKDCRMRANLELGKPEAPLARGRAALLDSLEGGGRTRGAEEAPAVALDGGAGSHAGGATRSGRLALQLSTQQASQHEHSPSAMRDCAAAASEARLVDAHASSGAADTEEFSPCHNGPTIATNCSDGATRTTRSGQLALQKLSMQEATRREQSPSAMRERGAAASEARLVGAHAISDTIDTVEASPCHDDLPIAANCSDSTARMTRSGQLALQQRSTCESPNRAGSPSMLRQRASAAAETRLHATVADSGSIDLLGGESDDAGKDNLVADNDSVDTALARGGEPVALQAATPAGATVVAAEAAAAPGRPRRSRAGALALATIAAAEAEAERRRAEIARRKQEEEAAKQFLEESRVLIGTQDQEFQQSLLMDQMKDLLKRQEELQLQAGRLDDEVEASSTTERHALQRLERFGANPRLAEEAERAAERRAAAEAQRSGVAEELRDLEVCLADKNEILAATLA